MTQSSDVPAQLAIQGGKPAKQHGAPPMYPGGNLIDQEEEASVLETLRSRRLFRYYGPIEGPSKVEQLETEFAAYMGAKRALAVTSGTAALITALHAIGVGPGDEVIVPAYTWIASAAAVLAAGGVPIVAEIDDSLTLDPQDAEAKITPYTKAIMPVHMRGTPCQMDEIMAVARRHNLKVIEDAAQADGASYKGRQVGSIGDVGCFSLQFNKILTSGEGGMVITSDEAVWKRAVMYHDVIGGMRNNFSMDENLWGINFRMPELLGAVMLVQLRRLTGLLSEMRARKHMLIEGLKDTAQRKGVRFQQVPDPQGDASVACILLMPDAPTAERVAEALRAENIGAGVLYQPERIDYHIYRHWVPIMEQRTWAGKGDPWSMAQREIHYSPDMCPRSLDLLGRAIHLDVNPMESYSELEETIDGLNRVISALA
jgi:8-amino-3,8-dideoxy-alpha-D-manno-octulosonate transaminase